jgi:predicted amidophosphoribosyltransferase
MGYGQEQDYEATLPVCSGCSAVLDQHEAEDGFCDGCIEQQKLDEQREQWEREQMEDHYRRHPHG